MTAPDRIPCINPRCRRTAPQAKFPDSDYVICRGCWKLVRPEIKARWERLKRLDRRLNRLTRKAAFAKHRGEQWARIVGLFDRAQARFDADLHHYFREPEASIGLEAFMEETGL